MAEANGNRTHLSQQSCDTQVLKTRRVTRPYAPPAADYSTSRPVRRVAMCIECTPVSIERCIESGGCEGERATSLASLDQLVLKLVSQVGSNQFVQACGSRERVVTVLRRSTISW